MIPSKGRHADQLLPRQRKILKKHQEFKFDPTREQKIEALQECGYESENPINYDKAISRMRGQVRRLMGENGLGLSQLMVTHKGLLNAKHPKYKDSPDNPIRLQALKLGYEMHDIMPSKKVDIKSRSEDFIGISIETKNAAQQAAQEIQGEIIEAEEIDDNTDECLEPPSAL